MAEYNVAVIGGGPGGYTSALRAAVLGARVCLVEKTYLGGTCLNVGCIPTKALLHTSEMLHAMQHADAFGLATGGTPSVDFAKVMKRTREVVGQLTGGVGQLLKARKVDVLMGAARLLGGGKIEVADADGKTQTVTAENIIIATGSEPARPAVFPFDGKQVVTTDEATTSDALPEEILIVGGGIIGCEFATVYSELDCKVTVVEMLDALCPGLDKDIARAVGKSLKARGVDVKVGTKITEMTVKGKTVTAKVEGGEDVTAGMALVAVGRVPATEGIGLEAAGVEVDGRLIRVDDQCRTNVAGIFAIGDCACVQQYAHVASRMGAVAAENACGHDAADRLTVVPSGIYTHPEIGMVGQSEAAARQSGAEVKVVKFPLTASGMARAFGETAGMVKLVADAATGEILGAVCVGPHATDVVHEIAVAMKNELTVEEIAETIHAHPTFSEAVLEAAELWLGKPVHTVG